MREEQFGEPGLNLEEEGIPEFEEITEGEIDKMLGELCSDKDRERIKADIEAGEGPSEKAQNITVERKLGFTPKDRILDNICQPRVIIFDSIQEKEDMIESIRVRGNVLRPIIVVPHPTQKGFFMLKDGFRRTICCKEIREIEKIFSIFELRYDTNGKLIPVDKAELIADALVANRHQKPLSPIEEALAMANWLEETGGTIKALSQQIGKTPSTINNLLRLLKLNEKIQVGVLKGEIQRVVGQSLTPYPSERQVEMYKDYEEILKQHGGTIPSSNAQEWVTKVLRKIAEDRKILIPRRRRKSKTHAQMVFSSAGRSVKKMNGALEELKGIKSKDLYLNKDSVIQIVSDIEHMAEWAEEVCEELKKGLALMAEYEGGG